MPLVVMLSETPVIAPVIELVEISPALNPTISSRSARMSGSPPVKRMSRTPRSRTAMPTSRAISCAVSSWSRAIAGRPSEGMQYVQRREHFSVMETRRSWASRPKRSMRPETSGRPSVDGGTPGSRRMPGNPSESVMIQP